MGDYLTDPNPTTDDWLAHNADFFEALRQGGSTKGRSFALLTDIDRHAEQRGISTEQLFEELRERVGDLGAVELSLSHTDMDDSWHVVLTPKEA